MVAGPRGSGRSYLLRAVAAELERHGMQVIVLRPSATLTDVPFGVLDATGHPELDALRTGRPAEPVRDVVILDDVDALDTATAAALARAVASNRLTALIGLRTSRARSVDHPDDADVVRRAMLDLWLDGFARRVDLRELSDDDALALIDLFPDAHLLDSTTRAGLVWRADGSRTLMRHLILEATAAARSGKDPLTALRNVARQSRLAMALERHVAEMPRTDLESLAGIRRLRHLELSVATRLFDAESVAALLEGGQMHADSSAHRRLTVNDLLAAEAQRQLGSEHVDSLVEAAGARMLAEADVWWSPAIAVSIAERWHRQGSDSSVEGSTPPAIRARIARDAARDANDRGDTAHAAAYAQAGLNAVDDPLLRLEAALATRVVTNSWPDADHADLDAQRRLARSRVESENSDDPDDAVRGSSCADARVERLLTDSAQFGADMDWVRAADTATTAIGETDASPVQHLRAVVAAGTSEAVRGRWAVAQRHYRATERILDARPQPEGIDAKDRLAAIMFMLAGHQLAGADGTLLQRRLERELATTAREGEVADLTIAGIAAAISYTAEGSPARSQRELITAATRSPTPVSPTDGTMVALGVADELAMAGAVDEARAMIDSLSPGQAPLLRRSIAYVETTILTAEGRLDEAREAARATAEFSRGGTAAAFRIRDLFRLIAFSAATAEEIDELVQLAAVTDLPLSSEAVRRVSARTPEEGQLPVDDLRLHALWSGGGSGGTGANDEASDSASRSATHEHPEELTSREREIALMAHEGLTNREIATRLFLSIRTVESHVYQARMKVGATTRRELGRLIAEGRSADDPRLGARASRR